MIAHLREREKNLEPFGWNPQDAEWVAMVCLHSGVFTRSQYTAFFNAHPSRAHRFVQNLLDLKLAVLEPIPVIRRLDRTRACRITHKGIYRELGVPNIRHRRFADPAAYLRRLLSLDYVIERARAGMAPDRRGKGLLLHGGRRPQGAPAEADLYRGGRWPCPLLSSEAPHCRRADHHVCLCRSRPTEPPPSSDIGAGHTSMFGVSCGSRGITIHVAAIGINPDADNRARAVLAGWARDNAGANGGITAQIPRRQSCRRKWTHCPGRSIP